MPKLYKSLIKKDELLRLQQKVEAVHLFEPRQIHFMLSRLTIPTKQRLDAFFEDPAKLLIQLDTWSAQYGVSRQDLIEILSHVEGLRHLESLFEHHEFLSKHFLTSELLVIANKTFAHRRFEVLHRIYMSLISKGYDKAQIYQMASQSGGAVILLRVEREHDKLQSLGYHVADVFRVVLFKQGHINLDVLLIYHQNLCDLGYSLQQIVALASHFYLSQYTCLDRFEFVRVNTERLLLNHYTRESIISLATSPSFLEESDVDKLCSLPVSQHHVTKRNRESTFFSPRSSQGRAVVAKHLMSERQEAMWMHLLDHAGDDEETSADVLPMDDSIVLYGIF